MRAPSVGRLCTTWPSSNLFCCQPLKKLNYSTTMPTIRLMPGIAPSTWKKHPSLIPLWVALGGGMLLAGTYLTRLATRNPDTSWDRKNNPHPWQKMKQTDQYKVMWLNATMAVLLSDSRLILCVCMKNFCCAMNEWKQG